MMETKFKRERRYVVLKLKDISQLNSNDICELQDMLTRLESKLPQRNYVVVEDDWPEYEKVWAMIEARITGVPNECDQLRAENEALRKDAERIDWLESNPRYAQIMIDGKAKDCVFYGISCATLMKLRDAIDAAMKSQ